MSNDSGERMPDASHPDFLMPKMLDVQIRRTSFEPRPLRNFTSALASSNDAVEFIVKTNGPIPIRALGPALYVGEIAVTEVSELGPNVYSFIAPTGEDMKQNAKIFLSWTGQPTAGRERADFRYRI